MPSEKCLSYPREGFLPNSNVTAYHRCFTPVKATELFRENQNSHYLLLKSHKMMAHALSLKKFHKPQGRVKVPLAIGK